jgi:hypothetical protein
MCSTGLTVVPPTVDLPQIRLDSRAELGVLGLDQHPALVFVIGVEQPEIAVVLGAMDGHREDSSLLVAHGGHATAVDRRLPVGGTTAIIATESSAAGRIALFRAVVRADLARALPLPS